MGGGREGTCGNRPANGRLEDWAGLDESVGTGPTCHPAARHGVMSVSNYVTRKVESHEDLEPDNEALESDNEALESGHETLESGHVTSPSNQVRREE